MELKVVSLNIFHDLPRYHKLGDRLELIARAIASEQPHIAVLQEVLRAPICGDLGLRLDALLRELTPTRPYSFHYAPADGAGEGEYAFDTGVAIFSLAPYELPAVIKFEAQLRLSTTVGGISYRLPDDRIALRMQHQLSDGLWLDCYVTHLTDSEQAADSGRLIREEQARELVAWIEQKSAAERSVLVAGDFNDVPDSKTVRCLTDAGFIDVYGAAGDAPGYTNDRNDISLDSPEASHNQRIDYLFLRPGLQHVCEITNARLFLDRAQRLRDGSWLWASDHIGLIATLRLSFPTV